MSEKKNESTFSVTPGQLLAAAREARSLSQADIAKHTRLSVQAIDALERDDFAYFGVRTFVRGYLCCYAKFISIPEKQVLDALDASDLMSSDTHSLLPRIEGAPVLNVTHQRSYKFNRRWVMGAVFGVVVIAGFLIWKNSKDTIDKSQVAANVLKTADSIALSQPQLPVETSTPAIVISKPVVVAKAPSQKKPVKQEKAPTQEKTQSKALAHVDSKNGFVINPSAAMHTTYTIKPAS